jgi:hypothetical protein
VAAGEGVFIGWGQVPRGRERKALEVFNESVAYWNSLKEGGQVESVDVVLLGLHGGDLYGFALLRGDGRTLDEVQRSDEWRRSIGRASLVVDGLGVVPAVSGESLAEQMALYQQLIGELA